MKSLHILLVSLFALQVLLFASTSTEATRLLRLSLGFGDTRPSWTPSLKVSLMKPPGPRHLPPPPHPRHLTPPPSPGCSPEPGPGKSGTLASKTIPCYARTANSQSLLDTKSSELNPYAASA